MTVLKSQFGLIEGAVYVLFDKVSPIVTMPGLIVLAAPLELIGVRVNDEPYKTLLLIASAVVTALMVYLLGAGVEALSLCVRR